MRNIDTDTAAEEATKPIEPHPISEEDFRDVCHDAHVSGALQTELRSLIDAIAAKVIVDIKQLNLTPDYSADRSALIKALDAIVNASKALTGRGPCADFGLRQARVEIGFPEVSEPAMHISQELHHLAQAVDRALFKMEGLPEAGGGPKGKLGRTIARRNALKALGAFYVGRLGKPLDFGRKSEFLGFCQAVFERTGLDDFVTGLQDAAPDALWDPLEKRVGETPPQVSGGSADTP